MGPGPLGGPEVEGDVGQVDDDRSRLFLAPVEGAQYLLEPVAQPRRASVSRRVSSVTAASRSVAATSMTTERACSARSAGIAFTASPPSSL
ncbi:hypothetical protein [Streptomyces sp. NBC_00140]|uniref:hypothetical protein n=1 Tax=Streptomyces sp. NBC_00140 TaxID=2975664 RepID=UPI002252F4F3|nr:hypothetical protein [Streptomyces sp. NBC_00140]MCX5332689.1 hypothetical protein [Streptomyces sp. NBC_00140]